MFKYCWIWEKSRSTGFLNSWKRPMLNTEDICVFYKKQCKYNPIIKDKDPKNIRKRNEKDRKKATCYGKYEFTSQKCPNDKTTALCHLSLVIWHCGPSFSLSLLAKRGNPTHIAAKIAPSPEAPRKNNGWGVSEPRPPGRRNPRRLTTSPRLLRRLRLLAMTWGVCASQRQGKKARRNDREERHYEHLKGGWRFHCLDETGSLLRHWRWRNGEIASSPTASRNDMRGMCLAKTKE